MGVKALQQTDEGDQLQGERDWRDAVVSPSVDDAQPGDGLRGSKEDAADV